MRRIKNGADIMRRFMREFLPARTRDMHISRFIYDFITQKCFIRVAVWVFCVCVCYFNGCTEIYDGNADAAFYLDDCRVIERRLGFSFVCSMKVENLHLC